MNKKLKEILENFSDGDLKKWSDSRSISRGRGYVNHVHDIVAVQDGGVTAKVDGTHRYLATIIIDKDGEAVFECSCPVGAGCKHCVALAIRCRDLLNGGKKIKTLPPDNQYWRDLKFEFGEEMEVFGVDDAPLCKDEKGVLDKIAGMSKPELKALVDDLIENVPEVLPYLSHKHVMESASVDLLVKNARKAIVEATQDGYNYWEHHGRGHYYDDYDDVPDYSKVEEYFKQLAKLGCVRELMKLCDYFIERCEEQLNISDDEGEMICDMQNCVKVVARAIYSSGLEDSEKLLWEYNRHMRDSFSFLQSEYDETLTYWKKENISSSEWSKVADSIIKDYKKDSGEDDFELSHRWRYLSASLRNAGRWDEALKIAIDACKTTAGYLRVIEILHSCNRIEEAKDWCRKGFDGIKMDDWRRNQFTDWFRRFAAERGDWATAAAYDVARFLQSPKIEGFIELEKVCGKVKLWKRVRRILVESLANGRQPLKQKGWPLSVPDYAEATLNERYCPMAELLCRIALHEKDAAEASRWFQALVDHKTESAILNHVYQHEGLAFSVADAIKKEIPDRAIYIWRLIIAANCRSAGNHYYETIVYTLKAMKATMVKVSGERSWRDLIVELRETYRQRRNLVQKLDAMK